MSEITEREGVETSCCECGAPATWVRCTQFAGNHPYCTTCAEREEDFGKDDDYFYWAELPAEVIARKHPIDVEGYENQLTLLVERVHRMHYNKVADFYQVAAEELSKQAQNDFAKGRGQLASLLEEAAWNAARQRDLFSSIWKLCKPHMQKEDREE